MLLILFYMYLSVTLTGIVIMGLLGGSWGIIPVFILASTCVFSFMAILFAWIMPLDFL